MIFRSTKLYQVKNAILGATKTHRGRGSGEGERATHLMHHSVDIFYPTEYNFVNIHFAQFWHKVFYLMQQTVPWTRYFDEVSFNYQKMDQEIFSLLFLIFSAFSRAKLAFAML